MVIKGKPADNGHYTEVHIDHVHNVNPNAKTVVTNVVNDTIEIERVWFSTSEKPVPETPVLARVKNLRFGCWAIVKYDARLDTWWIHAEIPGREDLGGWFGINKKSIIEWTEI